MSGNEAEKLAGRRKFLKRLALPTRLELVFPP